MKLSIYQQDDITKLLIARTITSFGSGFSKFIIPLFVLQNSTNDTKHVGLQWGVMAITQLLACFICPRLNFFKNDKYALVISDYILAIVSIIPLIFFNSAPIISAYIVTILTSFFLTLQSGFFESLIGHVATNNKASLFTRCKSAENLGLLLGFSSAGICTTLLGYKSAFIIDALTFFISGLIFLTLKKSGTIKKSTIPKMVLPLIFTKELKNLSISQIFIAFSLFILNGTYVVVFKKSFLASDLNLSSLWVIQFIIGFSSTFILAYLSKKKEISNTFPYLCRLGLGLTLAFFAFINTKIEFIILYSLFGLFAALSVPLVQAMFQKNSNSETARHIAIARITITSLSGSLGALVGAIFLEKYDYKYIYIFASLTSLVGSYYFWKHIKELNQSTDTNPSTKVGTNTLKPN